ncbi:hypothetical protein C8D88_102898 [Lentzea atacamensis]|uniref:Uncharacterized protein n=2 Tax=Lentzea TaxID=165301 RepID=A0A316IAE1_9PSEU|nr:hypothetical protein C8D88_102898 [Lentzea atacamensis]
MCFMFGASKEHVHRMLGLVDEAKHDDEEENEEALVAVDD